MMLTILRKTIFPLIFICLYSYTFSQDIGGGNISGNFQTDIQYYLPDSQIAAPKVKEKVLMNGFGNLNYTFKNFSAGIRYEAYLNPLLGFDPRYQGSGIPYRFASFQSDEMEVTVGNFYEQFGNGLIFRTYEEKSLGIDNALDGIRMRYTPVNGVSLKGVYGKQRFFFTSGPGIVRGADGEVSVNDLIQKFSASKTRYTLGGSFLSRYQEDKDPLYNLPENVAAFAGRLSVTRPKMAYSAEYAHKVNDPSAINKTIYKTGHSLLASVSYSEKGRGATLSVKRVDNMDFRSDRTASGSTLQLNFIPPIARQHTYTLVNIYPYATQSLGEMGVQGDIFFTLKPESMLGGKYGTQVNINFSRVNGIKKESYGDERGYKSNFLEIGKEIYFQDINIEINKKLSSKTKLIISNVNLIYNKDVIQGLAGYGSIYANIAIVDLTQKLNDTHSLRFEVQQLQTKQDEGSWALASVEYTIAPKWFVAVSDMYNYGNKKVEKRLYYYNVAAGYTKNALRIALSYGRQRAGLLCVGGICRYVPASNGFTLSISNTF